MLTFYQEFLRNKKRLEDAIKEISTCAISGAVGTFANIDPRVEKYVAKKLKLNIGGSEDYCSKSNKNLLKNHENKRKK